MRRLLLAILGAVAATGCYTSDAPPTVEPTGDEVTIFVHGIKGSFLLAPDGDRAWLDAHDVLTSGDRSLALPPGGEDRFGPLQPGGPLTRFTIFPLIATSDVYLPWLEYGEANLPGFTSFSYDWRFDAREAVEKLAKRIDELAEKRDGKLKVNLVGHSLGGLIAFTYVRYGSGDPAKGVTWAGARYVKRLVLAGAPFGGSPGFLKDILQGDPTGRNVRLLAAEAMASFVPSYELLPSPGTFFVDPSGAPLPLDASDTKTWETVPPSRRPTEAALEASRAFRQGLREDPGAPPPPPFLRVLVIAGTGRPTIHKVTLAKSEDIDSADFEASPTTSGDERVPADACTPPRPSSYKLIPTSADHVGLLNDEAVQEAIGSFISR